MTRSEFQHSYKQQTMNRRRTAYLKRSKMRLILLLVLPTIMIMMMVMGAAMPTSNASNKGIGVAGTGFGKDDTPVIRVDAPVTNEASNEVGSSETTTEEKELPKLYTARDVEVVAKTVYGEALVTHSDMEMAAVVWCILNRVDSQGYACGGTIERVTTFPGQFHGYDESHPVTKHIEELVIDVFERWMAEKNGEEDVGRVLPKEYIYFWGDGKHNYFTTEFLGGETWEWEAENPYEN